MHQVEKFKWDSDIILQKERESQITPLTVPSADSDRGFEPIRPESKAETGLTERSRGSGGGRARKRERTSGIHRGAMPSEKSGAISVPGNDSSHSQNIGQSHRNSNGSSGAAPGRGNTVGKRTAVLVGRRKIPAVKLSKSAMWVHVVGICLGNTMEEQTDAVTATLTGKRRTNVGVVVQKINRLVVR